MSRIPSLVRYKLISKMYFEILAFEYVRARELKPEHVIDPAYLQKQKLVTPRHRYILVNWMMEVQESDEHYFRNEQLFQAVRFIDAYLRKESTTIESVITRITTMH